MNLIFGVERLVRDKFSKDFGIQFHPLNDSEKLWIPQLMQTIY